MKSVLLKTAASLVFAGILASPATTFGQTSGNVTPGQSGRKNQAGKNERHPAIRAAIGALERAKADMQRASHDFGGHRADALKACDDAIGQLKQALAYDKK